MLKHGRRRVLLADATKCKVTASVKYAQLSDFDLWITAGAFDKKLLAKFKKMCQIKVAKNNI
jgi:DeoR/GlpR family transcriptional regulator of sugar metabolism